MAKQKIYDPSLINSVRQRSRDYSNYLSPKADLDSYVHTMSNIPTQDSAPDSFGASDYLSNAFYDWNLTRNETNKDTALGEYVFLQKDYDILTGAQQYLEGIKNILQLRKAMETDPNANTPENKQLLREESIKVQNNKSNYDKLLAKDFNDQAVSDNIFPERFAGKPIDLQIEIIQTVLGDGEIDRQGVIARRDDALKKAEKYKNFAEYWQSKMTSQYYSDKKNSPGMDLTDIDTYLYKLPGLLGSSASSAGSQLIGTLGAMFSTRGAGGVMGTLGSLTAFVTGNVYARDQESKAEVYQNYKQNVMNSAKKDGIDKQVLKDAKSQMQEMGYTQEQIDNDDFVYDQILSNKVKVNNNSLNRIRLNKMDGLKSLYTDNMALSGSDIVQTVLEVTPLGPIAKKVRGSSSLKKLANSKYGKTAQVIASKTGNLKQQLADRIDDVVAFGIESIDKLPRLTRRKAIKDIAGRIVITSALEGAEEGVQYIKGQRYIDGDFESDPNLISSYVRNLGTGARSVFAAITPWDPVYSDDQEFMENFKGGALLGGLMTSVIGTATSIKPLNDQISGDRFLAALYADREAQKDQVRKNILYGSKIREGKWNTVETAFDDLINSKIDGIDVAEIQEEQKRARQMYNIFTSNRTVAQAQQLDIDPRTEDYDIFVALKDHHDQQVRDARSTATEHRSEADNLLYSPQVQEYIEKLNIKNIDQVSTMRSAIAAKIQLDTMFQLYNEFQNKQKTKLEQIQKHTGTKTSKADVVQFAGMLNKDIKSFQEQYENLKKQVTALGIKEEDLEVPSLHQDLKEAYEKVIASELDLRRAEMEQAIMESTDKEAIQAKIDKWKDVEDASNKFMQRLDDLYSGKTEKQNEQDSEDVKPEVYEQTPEPVPPTIEDEVKEPTDISDKRRQVVQNREQYFTQERDSRGNNKFVLNPDNTFGDAYKNANMKLQQSYKLLFPNTKNYSDNAAQSRLASSNRHSEVADAWEEVYNLRNQLEEEVGENGATPKAEELVKALTQKSNQLIDKTKESVEMWEAYSDFISSGEYYIHQQLERIKDKQHKLTEQQNDVTPTKVQEAPSTIPVQDETKTQPAQVGDIPTLGSILGGLIGDEDAKAIDQAAEPEVPVEQVTVPMEEPITDKDNDKVAPLTYDQQLDPYSHELNYRLSRISQDKDGNWTVVTYNKFQGMEKYLNNKEFSEISAAPDFVSEVTKNGVHFEVRPYTNESGVTSDAIYAIFRYKDKEYVASVRTETGLAAKRGGRFNKLPYEQQQYIKKNLQDLRNKILELNKQVKLDTDLQIVPTFIRTTSGSIVNEVNADGTPKNRNIIDSAWQKVKDPYQINPSNTEVGISTGPKGKSIIRLKDRVLSYNGKSMGKPFWIIKAPNSEGAVIDKPIQLNYKYFKDQPKVADLILDLVTSNNQFYTDANGVQTSINPKQLLHFIVNFGSHTATNPEDTRLNNEQIQQRLKKQFYIDDNNNVVIGTTTYSISDLLTDKNIREQAKQYIMDNFHYAIDEDGLNKNWLGGDLQNKNRDPHFESLHSFFKNSNVDKLVIVPGEIEFTPKDFGIEYQNGKRVVSKTNPNGISVLGWYIKQGILMTDIADNLQDANIYVDDVAIQSKSQKSEQQQAQQHISEAVERDFRGESISYTDEQGNQQKLDLGEIYKILDGKKRGPNMTVEDSVKDGIWYNATEKMDVDQAKQWIEKTLGITPEITNYVIDVTEAGQSVVGRVTVDSIKLYNDAPKGVEFHEAWHRVSQLCIDEKHRRKIYDRYKKKSKSNLSDAAIDEILAEQFREFMLNDAAKYDFDTKNWFRRILDFIKLWARTGQYTLAKVYADINRGKYYGVKPNDANVERFKSIYSDEGPNFEVNGYQFKTITKTKQFDDIVKSLTYAFFQCSFVEGKSIDYTDINPKDYSFERLKLIVEAQKNKFPSEALTEIYDNFDNIFAPAIASKLKSLNIRAIDNDDITAKEEGEEGIDIGQHTVEGMNISIKDNAPAEVKFFFQTIPMRQRNTDGTYSAKIDAVTKFPSFVDSNTAWNNVLKDLAGCRTIANIMDRIVLLSQNDQFYASLLIKFADLVQRSTNPDPNVAIKAEAMLTKLETVITSDINNYVTAKISQDESGMTTMKLTDNTVDMKAMQYPKVWSRNMFENSGIFKYNEDGIVVAQDNAKSKINTVLNALSMIKQAFVNNKGIIRTKDGNFDLHETQNQERLKDYIVSILQEVGIGMDKPTINKMLLSGDYGNPKSDPYTLLNTFVVNTVNFGGLSKISDTLKIIQDAIKPDNTLSAITISGKDTLPTQIWNEVGYVKALANYYAFVHATDKGLGSLGPDGNTYYMVSQNNFAKDRVNELITDPELFHNLEAVVYNEHSIILSAVRKGNKNIQVETFINFKDETSYDAGRDYFNITQREDYLAKMTAIFNDRIIFPTVADKKTYHFIRGIKLPHERIRFTKTGNGVNILYGEQSLDTIIGYCQDELNQIELCLRQIDDDPTHYDKDKNIHYNANGTVNNDWLDPSRRIKNFHTPNKYKYKDDKGIEHTVTLEGNGARFLFLTGVYVNGKFIDFNNPSKSAIENLQTAKDYFFNAPIDTQKQLISGLINRRMKDELKTARDLGLIEINENLDIWSIRNKLLDDNVLADRQQAYESLDANNAEGYAIFDMLADYTINSIISVSEIEKIFNGAPAYYKVKYDRTGILDLSVDKIKRLGSLTSTGTNNRLDFFSNDPMREEYVVAELKDHEIQSKQYYTYRNLFTLGNIKETIQEMNGEDAWNEVKNLSIQEIEKQYPEEVKIAKQAAEIEVRGYKEGINVADAAVYISPIMTRDLLRMRGQWSPEIKEAFDILMDEDTAEQWDSNPELYAKANKVILNAMKYMAFGTRFNEIPGLGIPYFNKMALFPLFKSVATGDIRALYDRMMDEDPNKRIDMVMFDSAVKAGSRAPMKAYKAAKDSEIELKDGQTVLSAHLTDQLQSGEGNTLNDFNNLVTYTQKFKYLRQQLATDPHTHEETMAGTQFMKVNLSNIRMNDMYGKEGEQVSGQTIKDTVMNALNRLSDIGKAKLQGQLFTEDGQVNVTALGEMLTADARESDANDNIISGLKTINNAFTIPLSALSDNKWLESRFISMINKEVIDVHMPGGAFIQRSAFGLEATSKNVITPSMINDGRALKAINEEGSMDAVVSINLFKHFIPNYKKMTFRQARQWLIDHDIIGQKATANSIGYRIPTQSIASISPLRFVDVFPEIMGDTIMLPEDFTKLTGSDFDIDKLYVARFSYNEDGVKINHDIANSTEQVANAIKNEMLDAYMKVLLTKDNTNSLKLSIDNATENTKEVLKDIESNREVHHVQPFEVYTPSYQEARKAEYTGGKAGIGPFALNNAHHILTQLVGLKMESNAFTEAMKIVDLGRIYDYPTVGTKKGGRILDWLSAMINGFVDIAKDPYIVRLNVNAWTYNMVSFLLRTGKGKWAFYFVGQPILKEIAEEVLKTKGKYGVDRTKSPSQLEKEAIESVLDKYDPTGSYRKEFQYINSKPELKANAYKNLFETFFDENGKETSYCRELLLNNGAYNDLNKRQIGIYYAWLALKPYADDLANLVKYSKIDTKKTGKTFAEQQIYYNGMQDLAEESHFAPGEVRRFYDETFIARKTENSIPFGSSIFRNLLFRNTDTFISQYNTVLSLLGRKNNANSKLLNPIISGMEAQLKAEFFNQYVEDNNIDVKGLFYGRNSIAKRLNKFKNMIFKGEYKYLLNADGTINNDFLNYLLPNITHDGLDFIDTSELLSSDQSQANNLINYWRELLDDPNPEIKRLARDLAIYAFYVSGDNPSMNSFFQYLPNSFRKEIGYTDYIQGKLDQLVNGSQLGYKNKTDLFLNNWTNDSLVKPVSMYSGKNNEQLRGVYINDKAAMPNIIMGQRVGSDKPAIRPINWIKVANQDGVEESFPLFPPYIKLRDGLGFGPQNWHVYTIIGYKSFVEIQPNGKPGKTVYIPLYGLISKKGYKHKGHSIVEYGRETAFDFNKENEWDYVEALNNKDALADMALQQERQDWIDDAPYIHHITELPSYQNMNYALARQDRVYTETEDDVNMDDEFFPVLEEREEPTILADYSNIKNYLKTYSGIITNLEPNQIFVFGSNTQGRHGKGAALTAKNKFGAIYGQSEGIQGQSYAIITKDLTSSVQPSRTPEQIVEQINKLYTYARQHRDKEFLVAYSGTGTNLNYYSNEDLARMFAKYPIPDNIVFEKSFSELVFKYINKEIDKMFNNTNAAKFINHSGGALGSDTMWGKIGEEYGVYSKHYYAEGQKTPNGNTALGKQLLSESDVHLKEANKKLGRLFPTSKDYVNNLLRRNWFQVKNADAIFAIGTIADNGTVNGGTGWAVQMAIDNNKDVYVFDQSRLKWYRNRDHKWSEVTTPKLTPNFAGIGTREITQEGIQAIRNVYALTFRGQIENYISLENKSDLFPSSLPLTGVELMALYEQGNSRISEVLDQMEDLTPEERQTYLNEFSQFMTDNEVNTQDKLEEALRKFICNL